MLTSTVVIHNPMEMAELVIDKQNTLSCYYAFTVPLVSCRYLYLRIMNCRTEANHLKIRGHILVYVGLDLMAQVAIHTKPETFADLAAVLRVVAISIETLDKMAAHAPGPGMRASTKGAKMKQPKAEEYMVMLFMLTKQYMDKTLPPALAEMNSEYMYTSLTNFYELEVSCMIAYFN